MLNQKIFSTVNKIALRLFAVGVALIISGLIFFLYPERVFNNIEIGQAIIGMLAVLIALSVMNFWLNTRDLREKRRIPRKGSNNNQPA